MTVENITPSVEYVYADPTINNEWPYSFEIFSANDLVVELRQKSTNILIPMSIGSDYTIDTINKRVLTSKVLSDYSHVVLRIYRHVDRTQETVYVNNDPLNVKTIERDFDKAIMLIQELDATITRVVSNPEYKGEWQPNTLYGIGDLVKYNGKYYRSIAYGPSDATFNPVKWVVYFDVQSAADDVAAALAITPRPNFFDKSFVATNAVIQANELLLQFDPPIAGANVNNIGTFYFELAFGSSYNGGPLTLKLNASHPTIPIKTEDGENPTKGQLIVGGFYGITVASNKAVLHNVEQLPQVCTAIPSPTANIQSVSNSPEVQPSVLKMGMRFTYTANFTSLDPNIIGQEYGVLLQGMDAPIILRTADNEPIPEGAIQNASVHTFVVTVLPAGPGQPAYGTIITPLPYSKITRPYVLDLNNVFSASSSPTTLNLTSPTPIKKFFEGLEFYAQPTVTNTGPVTATIGVGAAVDVLTLSGVALSPGMLQNTILHHFICVESGGIVHPRLVNPYMPAVSGTATFNENILLLDADTTDTPPPTATSGLEVERGTEPNVQLVWDEQLDSWSLKGSKLTEVGDPTDDSQVMTLGYANGHYPRVVATYAPAVWDAANSRYDFGTGLTPFTLASGQRFYMKPDIANPGPVTIQIDGNYIVALKYMHKGVKYDLFPGEWDHELEMYYDGTDFIVAGPLLTPAGFHLATTSTFSSSYYDPPDNTWLDLDLSALAANPAFTLSANKLVATQPGKWSFTATLRHKSGSCSLQLVNTHYEQPHTRSSITGSSEYAHVDVYDTVVLNAGDQVWARYYAYANTRIRRDINRITATFLGRP